MALILSTQYAISAANFTTVGFPWSNVSNATGSYDGVTATASMDGATNLCDDLYLTFVVTALPLGSTVVGLRISTRSGYSGSSINPTCTISIPQSVTTIGSFSMSTVGLGNAFVGSTTNAYGVTAAQLAIGLVLSYRCQGDANDELDVASIDGSFLIIYYDLPTSGTNPNRRKRLIRRVRGTRRRGNFA
ncbi:MAG: hypothetical protein AB7V18_19490 [Pyrinomonadaceae bacterium]